MLPEQLSGLQAFVSAIAASGLSIYDPIEVGNPTLWIPGPELELLLEEALLGISISGLPLRTRSKMVKEQVCIALGYPVPSSFKRTRPRFYGQLLDVYVQKSNNLQVWNEQLAATRRYALVRISASDCISRVRVLDGSSLALLDTTGTLTQKYQARCTPAAPLELTSSNDTETLSKFVRSEVRFSDLLSPVSHPKGNELLSIGSIFDRLSSLVGTVFPDAGYDQERNRGAILHKMVCRALGYSSYHDDGQFPDVRHQLLEVKLQTAATIDLGLVRPDSTEPLDVPMLNGIQVRHCDVRYAVFYAQVADGSVILTHFILTTGQSFFDRFAQFQGRVLNSKLQIRLPYDFFE